MNFCADRDGQTSGSPSVTAAECRRCAGLCSECHFCIVAWGLANFVRMVRTLSQVALATGRERLRAVAYSWWQDDDSIFVCRLEALQCQ